MKGKKSLAAILGILTLFNAAAISAKELNLTINEDKVLKYSNPELFGMGFALDVGYLSTNSIYLEKRTELVRDFKNFPFPLARTAIGCDGSWKTGMGSWGERKLDLALRDPFKQAAMTVCNPSNVLDWLKTIRMIDRDTEFVLGVNVTGDTYENMADLVELCAGDPKENVNGGVNWAEERVKYVGEEEPFDIIWEIGNETDFLYDRKGFVETGEKNYVSPSAYVEICKRSIGAIRSVDPDAKIMAHVMTNQSDPATLNYPLLLLKEVGNEIDYFAIHTYYWDHGVVPNAEVPVVNISKQIYDMTGSDRIKFIYTEHGIRDDGRVLQAFLDYSDFYNRFIINPYMYGANLFCFEPHTSSNQWVAYYVEDGKFVPNPGMELMKMYYNNAVGDALDFKLDGYNFHEATDVTAAVVKTETGINIFFTNYDEKEDSTTILLPENEKYKIVSKTVMTGDSLDAKNDAGIKQISTTETKYTSNMPVKSVEIPKISITMIKLEEIK